VDDGLLVYRYIPAIGQPGKADSEYAVFAPHDKSERKKKFNTQIAKQVSLKFNAGNWSSLPTLHHTAERIAELPILSIVEGKVTEGKGVENLSQAIRIE
jgi:hypothetical protein